MDTNRQLVVTNTATPATMTVELLTTEIKQELTIQVNGFVRIGFLLKTARDTDILSGTSYKDVMEYARSEFGLTKDVVSRYIHICEKYSQGGNSDKLLPEYAEYGYSKLAEMLTLPDAIAEEITPETTRQEIQEIKKEYREEQAVTPLERMTEEPLLVPPMVEEKAQEIGLDAAAQTMLGKALYLIGKERKQLFKDLCEAIGKEDERKRVREAMAPNEQALYTVRIPQTGKVLVSVKDESVTITSMRSGEKETHSIDDVAEAFERLIETVGRYNDPPEELFSKLYKVAPVQPEETTAPTASGKSTDARKEERMAAAEGSKKENEKTENAESRINTEREATLDTDEASKTRGTDPENPIKTPSENLSEDEKAAQTEPEIIQPEEITVEEMTPDRLEESVYNLIMAAAMHYDDKRMEAAEKIPTMSASLIYHIRERKWEVAQAVAIDIAKAAGRMAEIEKEMFLRDDR